MPSEVAVTYAVPFDGDSTFGVPGSVGPYSAARWSNHWRVGLGQDLFDPNRGVVQGWGNEFAISAVPAAYQIQVATGGALVRGVDAYTTVNTVLDVPAWAGPGTRKDMLVLRRNGNVAVNNVFLAVKVGTALAYPTPQQDVADTGIWEIPVYQWESPIAADLTGVTFQPAMAWANLPRKLTAILTNNSGIAYGQGAVVVADAATLSFTISTTVADRAVIGVIEDGSIDTTLTGKIAVGGVTLVQTTGVVAVGDGLRQSSTAGLAERCTFRANGCFALALTASAGGTSTVYALLLLPAIGLVACKANRTTNLAIAGTNAAVTMTTEEYDTDSIFTAPSNRFTIPSDGLYTVGYRLFSTAGATAISGGFLLNGGPSAILLDYHFEAASASIVNNVMEDVPLIAGDTLDLVVSVSAGAETIASAEMWIRKVGNLS